MFLPEPVGLVFLHALAAALLFVTSSLGVSLVQPGLSRDLVSVFSRRKYNPYRKYTTYSAYSRYIRKFFRTCLTVIRKFFARVSPFLLNYWRLLQTTLDDHDGILEEPLDDPMELCSLSWSIRWMDADFSTYFLTRW